MEFVLETDSCNWISELLATLGNRPLNRLVMPASHDAGMYQAVDCTPSVNAGRQPLGANACNSQTQTGTILDQLEAGCRYFDIRPVLWNGTFYTGHYQINAPVTVGCNGPTLSQFLAQISQFMAETSDLVILKFSHYYNRNTPRAGFSADDFRNLISRVQQSIGPHLFTGPAGPAGLAARDMHDFLAGGGCVLTVYDALPQALHAPGVGIYRYADYPDTGDLVVFDRSATENTVANMATDQKAKLANQAHHDGNLFLLSWTLTQNANQISDCAMGKPDPTSILDLADRANATLQPTMEQWIADGTVTPKTIPNLIYVDANADFCLQTALYLNHKLEQMF